MRTFLFLLLGRTVCHSSASSTSIPVSISSGVAATSRLTARRGACIGGFSGSFVSDTKAISAFTSSLSLKPRLHLFKHRKTLLQIVLVLLDLFEMHLFLFFQPLCLCTFSKSSCSRSFTCSSLLGGGIIIFSNLEKSSADMTLWRSLGALIMSSVGGGPTPAPGGPRGGTICGCLSLTVGDTLLGAAGGSWPNEHLFLSLPLPLSFQGAGVSVRVSPHR